MLRAWLLCLVVCAGCQSHSDEIAFGTTEYDLIRLTAPASEIISAVPVQKGQWVQAGTLLVQLDTQRAQEQVRLAEAQWQEAEAVLAELTQGPRTQAIAAAQAQVQDASAKARNAAAQAARANALAKANMLSLSERDSAHSEQARAEAQRSAAEENLKLLQAGSRDEQLAQGRARLAAAASTLALQRQRLAELTLSAPSDGQVDELPYRVGERVARGALLATLLQGDQAYARLYIPQQQRASLAPGAALQLRISGYEQPLQGTVRSIAQAPAFTPYFALNQKERARLVYLTEVSLPPGDKKIPAGLSVQWERP